MHDMSNWDPRFYGFHLIKILCMYVCHRLND